MDAFKNGMDNSGQYVVKELRAYAEKFSGDTKTKVAAGVFVDDKLICGTNHLAYEIPMQDVIGRTALFYATMIHAECDLISKGVDLKDATIHVTLFPCDNCARALIAAGIKEVVAYADRPTAPYIVRAKELFNEHGIQYSIRD